MGETVIEKIIRNNVGKTVKPGDIVTVNVDRVMIHDIFIPFVAEKFEEMGFTKLWNPDKAVLIYDHLVPASQLDDTRHFHAGDAFARKYGMKNVHRSDGICHQLMTEAGYVKPGNIVFGTDSHTTTYGCVGAFSSGIQEYRFSHLFLFNFSESFFDSHLTKFFPFLRLSGTSATGVSMKR